MKELENWDIVEFSEIADFLRGPFGSSVKKSVCVEKGPETYKLYEQGNVINNDFQRGNYYITKEKYEELKKFELQSGDIVFTCAGTLGKIATAPDNIERGIINSVLMRVRVDRSKILTKYFLYYFQTPKIQNQIFSKSQGATIKNLFATKKLRSFTIPLPPIDTQKQIISKLEKAEKLKKLREESNNLTIDYINSIFYNMFKDDSDFEIVELGKVAKLINGRAYKREELLESGPTPVLRVGNFFSNDKWYYSDLQLDEDKYCEKGDLLFAWSASFGPRIWDGPRAIYHYHIWKVELSERLNKIFALYLLEQKTRIIKLTGHGSSMIHVTKANMEKMKISLPPIELQNNFASIVKNIDSIKEKQKQSKEQINDFNNCLMKKAFRGELC